MRKSSFLCLLLGAVVVASLLGCNQQKTMPDLSKLELPNDDLNDIADRVTTALKGLAYSSLTVQYSGNFNEGSPVVFSQDPNKGAPIDSKTAVTIQISGAGVKVPPVNGQQLIPALTAIMEAGLRPTAVTGDPTKPTVLSTTPTGNTVVGKGTAITVNLPAPPVGPGPIINLRDFERMYIPFNTQLKDAATHLQQRFPVERLNMPNAVQRSGSTPK
jgi:hypothetical protein